jgi:hypothetical protein
VPKKLSRAEELRAVATEFQDLSIAVATGGGSFDEWESARAAVLSQPEFLRVVPDWVFRCRFAGQFWPLMKSTAPTYQGRRDFL